MWVWKISSTIPSESLNSPASIRDCYPSDSTKEDQSNKCLSIYCCQSHFLCVYCLEIFWNCAFERKYRTSSRVKLDICMEQWDNGTKQDASSIFKLYIFLDPILSGIWNGACYRFDWIVTQRWVRGQSGGSWGVANTTRPFPGV